MWRLIVFKLFARERLMDMYLRAVVTNIDSRGRKISVGTLMQVTTTGGTKPLTKYEAWFMKPLIKRLMKLNQEARLAVYLDVTRDRRSLTYSLDQLMFKS